jgi:hypothetical protein
VIQGAVAPAGFGEDDADEVVEIEIRGLVPEFALGEFKSFGRAPGVDEFHHSGPEEVAIGAHLGMVPEQD